MSSQAVHIEQAGNNGRAVTPRTMQAVVQDVYGAEAADVPNATKRHQN